MRYFREEKAGKRSTAAAVVLVIPRWVKAVFFFTTMFVSLLVFSAPILLVVADAVLPSALFSVSLPPASTLSVHLRNYDFRRSLIDVPLVSILRSAVIFCVYSFCDRPGLSRGPYLAITTACSAASLVFVSVKASFLLLGGGGAGVGVIKAMEAAMFASSLGFAIGHVAVAYRTSCKERRKLLVYKIDIEAVSACTKGFLIHQKILEEARTR
ncbi:uncharacterized protein LOC127245808 [Andrographis paniculata]|uniref:uncharacterized protein LOC127245808 n=1 Tax=Andrographis paniculata TaxID=175694 RepID=UPI0021E8C226|nr:uncharacterized protein LOC127245808 [Andrographis paniculata]